MGFDGVLWALSAAVGRKCPAGGNNRGMRIATASVCTGFAMTGIFTWGAAQGRFRVVREADPYTRLSLNAP